MFIKTQIKLNKSQQLLYYLIRSKGTIEDKTKLAKLQYFVDFIHYAFNNKTISQPDIIYTKQKQGLLSRNLTSDIDYLVKNKLIEEKPSYHYHAIKDIKLGLTKQEIKTIEYVLSKYGNLEWRDLVDICHKQSPYLATKNNAIAEFFTAYNLVDEYPDYES